MFPNCKKEDLNFTNIFVKLRSWKCSFGIFIKTLLNNAFSLLKAVHRHRRVLRLAEYLSHLVAQEILRLD